MRVHQERLLTRIDEAETRMGEIDALFCASDFYDRTSPDEVKELQIERSEVERDVERLTTDWERGETEIGVAG